MKQGFTLIELLIALFVAVTGITGAFAVIQQNISAVSYSNSRFTAALLAQEGVEIIKNIRDTNLLKGDDWDFGFAGGGDFEVQYKNPRITRCSSCTYESGLSFLNREDDGLYNYNPVEKETKFKRKIHIDSDSDKLEIKVSVYWIKKGGGCHEFSLQEHIYNWW